MNAFSIGGHEVGLATLVAVLLGSAAVLSIARILYRQQRTEPTLRSRRWRIGLLVLAQPLCAVLLYFALFPPEVSGRAPTLVVATAGATTAQLDALGPGASLVALPEAPPLPAAERVPDLATALRRHPGVTRIRVVGAGLEARDRDVARAVELEFRAAPLPRGLVELTAPSGVVPGDRFPVAGRVEALPDGIAELLDPAGQRVDRVVVDANGRFELSGTARGPGVATWRLRLRDAQQKLVEDVPLPRQVEAHPAPRLLLLAGAPNPELKYLRRWARDAGLAMHTQIAAGGGLELGDLPLPLDAPTLSRFDVVVLDDRAWSAMGDAGRAALNEAVRAGLGVLLRVTATPPDVERRRLETLGFEVEGGRDAVPTRLSTGKRDAEAERARIGPGTLGTARAPDVAANEVPALTRRTLGITTHDGLPLVRDDGGVPLAVWRAAGRGRMALWTLTDSYRLVLAGRADLHAELWSRAIATVARAQPPSGPELDGEARQGERVILCGLQAETRVRSPAGLDTVLLPDPATGTRACAGFWPREAGWHRLGRGERSRLFHVRPRNEAPGLHAATLREATLRIAAGAASRVVGAAGAPREGAGAAEPPSHASPGAETPSKVSAATEAALPRLPGARWPWWLAWLLASAALWGLERSRAGRGLRAG